MRKLKVIDLFAGCGGLSDGFEQSGLFRTIAHAEWESDPCDTIVKRFREKWGYSDIDKRILRFDIQRTKELIEGWTDDPVFGSHEGLEKIVKRENGVDLIIGGPPCQAYSVAGRIRDEHGMHNDYRNYLFESYLEIVRYFRPKAVIFENVPGILSASPGGIPITERITKAFWESGYEIIRNLRRNVLIDLTLYGIPQRRSRVFMFGLPHSSKKGNIQTVLHRFYNGVLPKLQAKQTATVKDSIGDLPPFYPAKSECKAEGKPYSHRPHASEYSNHYPRYHNTRDIRIFRDLAEDLRSGKNHYSKIEELKKLYSQRTGKTSNIHKYYVLRWDEPSNTIPAHLYKDGLRHIHPDPKQARSISVREAARLQTFDDDYEFLGSMGSQYKMVGNAVPPGFAKILAKAIYELMTKGGKSNGQDKQSCISA